MWNRRHNLTFGCPIASQAVGGQLVWQFPLGFQQFDEESLGRAGIFSFLNEDIDEVTVLVDCSPKVPTLALSRHGDFIEKPTIPARPAGLLDSSCIVRSEGCTPLVDGFIGDCNSTFGKQIFDVAKAECEAMIEPNGAGDDVGREAISAVA